MLALLAEGNGPPDWLQSWAVLLLTLAAVGGLLVKWFIFSVRSIVSDETDRLSKESAKRDADVKEALDKYQAKHAEDIDAIKHQLLSNGGQGVKDQLMGISHQIAAVEARVEVIEMAMPKRRDDPDHV